MAHWQRFDRLDFDTMTVLLWAIPFPPYDYYPPEVSPFSLAQRSAVVPYASASAIVEHRFAGDVDRPASPACYLALLGKFSILIYPWMRLSVDYF